MEILKKSFRFGHSWFNARCSLQPAMSSLRTRETWTLRSDGELDDASWIANNVCDVHSLGTLSLRISLLIDEEVPCDVQRIEAYLKVFWTLKELYTSMMKWRIMPTKDTFAAMQATISGNDSAIYIDDCENVPPIYHDNRKQQRQQVNMWLGIIDALLFGLEDKAISDSTRNEDTIASMRQNNFQVAILLCLPRDYQPVPSVSLMLGSRK